MTALKTPAPDAPGEEWGALAAPTPGWREPAVDWPDMMPRINVPSTYQEGRDGPIGHIPSPHNVPDPDHWAWWGWFITLLGPGEWDNVAPGCAIAPRGEGWWAWMNGDWSEGMTLGRACIAAAANGRWPGGAE